MKDLKHLALFLTESCNLACDYCFAANMEGRNIDEPLAQQAIDLLFEPDNTSKQMAISFWGGEPLTCFEMLKRLVFYAQNKAQETNKKVRFSVPTNLTLLSDEIIDFFQEHKINPSLSCDGTEASQSLRRTRSGESSYPLVAEKLDLIIRRYQPDLPGVRMTVSPATADHFYDDVQYFLERGFRHVYFAPVVEADWTEQHYQHYEQQSQKLAEYWADQLLAGTRISFNAWDKLLVWGEFRRRGDVSAEKRSACGAGHSMIAVDIYGDFYPCQRFVFYDKEHRAESLGSVSEGLKPSAEQYRQIDETRLGTATKLCKDCEDLQRCPRICTALNYCLGGSIYTVDERLCRLNAIDQRMVDYLESKYGQTEPFRKYVGEYLVKAYSPDALSATARALFTRLEDADVDKLAQRASEILKRLDRNPRK